MVQDEEPDGEECDGSELNSESCASLGLVVGSLSCRWDCRFDVRLCLGFSDCGNGRREHPEECEKGDLAGQDCRSLGHPGGGRLGCTASCNFDESECDPAGDNCSNGYINDGEECDGTDLADLSCGDYGEDSGELGCTADCRIDSGACFTCGDGEITGREHCDGSNLEGQDCVSQGYVGGGDLGCSEDCAFDFTACEATINCGDGQVMGIEECDGSNLAGQSCLGLGHAQGELRCSDGCTLDDSGCFTCGDGQVSGPEDCDGTNLGGQSCQSQGFDSGQLGCGENCGFVATDCASCGNGLIETGEQCDGANLGIHSCQTQGFDGGVLACNSCSFELSACSRCGDGQLEAGEGCDDGGVVDGDGCNAYCEQEQGWTCSGANPSVCDPECGDGLVVGAEECDATNLDSGSCTGQGFPGGQLSCASNCTFSTDSCWQCGNGQQEGNEECDGPDLSQQSCGSLGWGSGNLGCDGNCAFDRSDCAACDNGLIEVGEDCDGTNLGGASCVSQGYADGQLLCWACTLSSEGCFTCGDGQRQPSEGCDDGSTLAGDGCSAGCQVEPGWTCSPDSPSVCAPTCGDGLVLGAEDCDGSNLSGQDCSGHGFDSGTLACYGNCTYNTTGCGLCGDGEVGGTEQCEDLALDGASCQSRGYTGGGLACAVGCVFDESDCYTCGDDVIQPAYEQCDGIATYADTCTSLGFVGGNLTCDQATCSFDSSSCTTSTVCGDGIRSGPEQCDAPDFGGQTCASLGHGGGSLACVSSCSNPPTDCTCVYDISGCDYCGNNALNGSEVCDGANLSGESCQTRGFNYGSLSCLPDCSGLDVSGCYECIDCSDCGSMACGVDGFCGMCSMDEDCCVPMMCSGGTCTI